MLGMITLQVALFFHHSLDLTLYWGATKDDRHVSHHHNHNLKNIKHYIDDVSKHNEIGLIYYYTKQLLQKHMNHFQYKMIRCKQFIMKNFRLSDKLISIPH